MDVPLALAVVSDHPRPLCDLWVTGGDHPPLAGGHVLCGIEAEDADVPDGPGPSAVVLGAVGLAGVLNDQNVPLFSDLHDGVHVAREAVEVDHDYGLRLLGDRIFDPVGIDVVGLRVDVAEDGPRPLHQNARGGGDEGEGGRDHLISLSNAQGGEGGVKACGAVADGDAVIGADVLGEPILEPSHRLPLGQDPALQNRPDLVQLIAGENRLCYRNHQVNLKSKASIYRSHSPNTTRSRRDRAHTIRDPPTEE